MPDIVTSSRVVPSGAGPIEVRWAEITDRGRRRENNQDAVLSAFPLFVVADGMGGHIGGEIASSRTVERLADVVQAGEVSAAAIEAALERAVGDIASHADTTDDGTGTTVTGVWLDLTGDEPTWVTLNIGDSRVYLFRDGALAQVTTDHSVVQELIAAGRLSPEEAENHPYGNVITRAVGPSDGVVPDYVRLEVVDGDRFVVCSDGLTKELTDYGILHFLLQHADPAEAVAAMLEAALENGGRDNVSIIVVSASRPSADEDTATVEISSPTAG
ncbi:protein phosphatase 2C domain-containing protein [Microbacterium sp. EYE_5]|uniref:PP2C family protein-serine/threonine phosphatase n=1 Tax=unclassified Microbacterium TaxID=2609290 RepID=UPI002002FAE3|nr:MULTISPECIES: protein phosphatase 2C domain-containing protein [unclassified Microbacterium]MCK6081392.1 protein phosphatase 2C domain-containing protein [Microbacterium sp. EYE_382]MCK6086662.1 protein phosphatase 2C domain-containing protein [Microbacterium sp. EYE_384]MCK6123840.1 protein phosphatase 2C domain-containing protein [Microbacterium sp. EYE_80]MCK6126749.1 protein phosphatase 2C domain-containing protein [Microbacterium sp. EYE_79]MCK6142347.1 protein phosphatase 2C domain-co